MDNSKIVIKGNLTSNQEGCYIDEGSEVTIDGSFTVGSGMNYIWFSYDGTSNTNLTDLADTVPSSKAGYFEYSDGVSWLWLRDPASIIAVTDITDVPTTATVGTPLTLTGTVVPSTATNKTIQWSVTDAGTTGASISGNTLNTASAGTVKVTATIINGITIGSDFTKEFSINVSSVGIVETRHAASVRVYPNPTRGELKVEGLMFKDIEIYDIMGRKHPLNLKHETLNSFDISHLANGIYFLRIQTDNGIVTKKVIKE
jgi:hypothetical protein